MIQMNLKSIVTIAALILLTGCTVAPKQAYSGPRLEPKAEAVLSAAGQHSAVGFDTKTFIAKVDGVSMRDTGAALAGQMFPYPHMVYLTPGRHTIELVVALGTRYSRGDVWFVAEPGETYTAENMIDGYSVKMWIANKRGEPVGGIAPPQK